MYLNDQNKNLNLREIEKKDFSNSQKKFYGKDSDGERIYGALENIQFKRLKLVFDLQRLSYQVDIIE